MAVFSECLSEPGFSDIKNMNVKSLIKKCLIFDDAVETYPWQKDEYKDCCVMRHKSNNKWFALIFELDGKLCINLKCPPDVVAVLKDQYDSIMPAWHMNKKHWCTVDANNAPPEVLAKVIKISFEITAPSKKKYKKYVIK